MEPRLIIAMSTFSQKVFLLKTCLDKGWWCFQVGLQNKQSQRKSQTFHSYDSMRSKLNRTTSETSSICVPNFSLLSTIEADILKCCSFNMVKFVISCAFRIQSPVSADQTLDLGHSAGGIRKTGCAVTKATIRFEDDNYFLDHRALQLYTAQTTTISAHYTHALQVRQF